LLAPEAKTQRSERGESSEPALVNAEDNLGIRRQFLAAWGEALISHSASECQC